jgi:hypothetical protein
MTMILIGLASPIYLSATTYSLEGAMDPMTMFMVWKCVDDFRWISFGDTPTDLYLWDSILVMFKAVDRSQCIPIITEWCHRW